MRSGEALEFHPLAKLGEGTLALSEKDSGSFESDSKDNPLVSEQVEPVTLPLRLFIPARKKSKALHPARHGVHPIPNKPNPGQEIGHPPAETKDPNCILSAS